MANGELPKEMTVDQLLAKQNEVKPLATLEPVEGKADVVKVTPWLPSAGCLCTAALVLPKVMIGSINLTGKTHHCCGKTLQVVEINFTKGAQVAVADVFTQLAASAKGGHGTGSEMHARNAMAARALRGPYRRARAEGEPCEGCLYNGQLYAVGSEVCMNHTLKMCEGEDGVYAWFAFSDC